MRVTEPAALLENGSDQDPVVEWEVVSGGGTNYQVRHAAVSNIQTTITIPPAAPSDPVEEEEEGKPKDLDQTSLEKPAVFISKKTSHYCYVCQICRKTSLNQFKFFLHLKLHYEPKKRRVGAAGKKKPPPHLPEEQPAKEILSSPTPLLPSLPPAPAPSPVLPPGISLKRITKSGRVSKPSARARDGALSVKKSATPPSEMKFSCDRCPKLFSTALGLKGHGLRAHQEKDPGPPSAVTPESPRSGVGPKSSFPAAARTKIKKPAECKVCFKVLSDSTALQIHERIHNDERPFQCTDCGTSFRQLGDLQRHAQSIHSEAKTFQCEFCGKKFARKYSLTLHRKIHSGEKNHVCDVCQKGFRAANYLQCHKRIHTGERPYVCDVCGRGFRIRADMKRHRFNLHVKPLQNEGARKAEEEALATGGDPFKSGEKEGVLTKAEEEALAIREMLKSEEKEGAVLC